MADLKKAFYRAKRDASSAKTNLYKHIDRLLKAIKTVEREFKGGMSQADAISYKIWDLGGQEVCLNTSNPSWTYGTVLPVRESYARDSNL